MKHHEIEVHRLTSARHDRGMLEFGIEATVRPRSAGEDGAAQSGLRIPVEHARSLLILLKEQLATLDKLQPRSRRSGRG